MWRVAWSVTCSSVLGHFLAYTYVRLSLERIPDVGEAGTIVLLLALFGVGGFVGNILVGIIVDRAFARLAVVRSAGHRARRATVVLLPSAVGAVAAAVLVWGFFFSSWLIIVNTWVGHRMPDRLERAAASSSPLPARDHIAAGPRRLLVGRRRSRDGGRHRHPAARDRRRAVRTLPARRSLAGDDTTPSLPMERRGLRR